MKNLIINLIQKSKIIKISNFSESTKENIKFKSYETFSIEDNKSQYNHNENKVKVSNELNDKLELSYITAIEMSNTCKSILDGYKIGVNQCTIDEIRNLRTLEDMLNSKINDCNWNNEKSRSKYRSVIINKYIYDSCSEILSLYKENTLYYICYIVYSIY